MKDLALWLQLVTGDWIELDPFFIESDGDNVRGVTDPEERLIGLQVALDFGEIQTISEAGMVIPVHAIARLELRPKDDLPGGIYTRAARERRWQGYEDPDDADEDDDPSDD